MSAKRKEIPNHFEDSYARITHCVCNECGAHYSITDIAKHHEWHENIRQLLHELVADINLIKDRGVR